MTDRSIAHKYPEVASRFSKKSPLKPNEVTPSSGKKVIVECQSCKKERLITARNAVEKSFCASCSASNRVGKKSFRTTHPDIARRASKNSPISPDDVSFGTRSKLLFDCDICGKSWLSKPRNLIIGSDCPVCSGSICVAGVNDVATTDPKFALMFSPHSPFSPDMVSRGSRSIADYVCKRCKNEWSASVRSSVENVGLCFECSHMKIAKRDINDLASRDSKAASLFSKKNYLTSFEVSISSNRKMYFHCSDCNKIMYRSVQDFISSRRKCYSCSKRGSLLEDDVANFIKTKDFIIERSVRSLIQPYEIDILLSDEDKGIEVNGDYWHSDTVLKLNRGITARELHQKKLDMSVAKGIDLVFIWESDWKVKRDEVKSNLHDWLYGSPPSELLTQLSKG